MEGMLLCALCGAGADVHCAADAAFLCAACDAQVHGANFLVSRHRRTRVSAPKGLDDCDVSGTTLSSSCVYEADSATTIAMAPRRPKNNRRPARGQAVLQRWAKHMGIVAPGEARQRAAAAARALLGVSAAVPRVPLRVAMAAALWREVAAAAHGSGVHDSADALRRLEACARVPARLVVATVSAVGRGARVKRPLAVHAEEGWGECS